MAQLGLCGSNGRTGLIRYCAGRSRAIFINVSLAQRSVIRAITLHSAGPDSSEAVATIPSDPCPSFFFEFVPDFAVAPLAKAVFEKHHPLDRPEPAREPEFSLSGGFARLSSVRLPSIRRALPRSRHGVQHPDVAGGFRQRDVQRAANDDRAGWRPVRRSQSWLMKVLNRVRRANRTL